MKKGLKKEDRTEEGKKGLKMGLKEEKGIKGGIEEKIMLKKCVEWLRVMFYMLVCVVRKGRRDCVPCVAEICARPSSLPPAT